MASDFIMAEQDSRWRQEAWGSLGEHQMNKYGPKCWNYSGCTVMLNREFHENWQYMGTVNKTGTQRGWVHQFRHRQHPIDGCRFYLEFISKFADWAQYTIATTNKGFI